MYKGSKICTLDPKNRFKLPMEFRSQISSSAMDKFIVINSFEQSERCLYLYPQNDWEKFEQKLSSLPHDKNTRAFRTYVLGGLIETEMDSTGRILIPQAKIDFLGIADSKEIRIFGDLEKFQIWNQDDYKEKFESGEVLNEIDTNDVLSRISF